MSTTIELPFTSVVFGADEVIFIFNFIHCKTISDTFNIRIHSWLISGGSSELSFYTVCAVQLL